MEAEASRPVRRLLLVRHATSLSADPTGDVNRRLSQTGRAEADRLGRHLAAVGRAPTDVLCSSARRARETLDALLEHWSTPPPRVCIDERLYLASADRLMELIAEADRAPTLLVVAHNPGLGALAYELTSGGPSAARIAQGYPPAACAAFEARLDRWSDLAPRLVRLELFVRPDDLG